MKDLKHIHYYEDLLEQTANELVLQEKEAGGVAVTVPVYWFNLDTKLVKLLEKPMMKHYDSMPRDNRL